MAVWQPIAWQPVARSSYRTRVLLRMQVTCNMFELARLLASFASALAGRAALAGRVRRRLGLVTGAPRLTRRVAWLRTAEVKAFKNGLQP